MTDEPEIEITEAMLRAGIAAFVDYNSNYEGPRDAVIEIYEAMVRAKAAEPAHASDCAVHNAPAMEPGACDCRPGA